MRAADIRMMIAATVPATEAPTITCCPGAGFASDWSVCDGDGDDGDEEIDADGDVNVDDVDEWDDEAAEVGNGAASDIGAVKSSSDHCNCVQLNRYVVPSEHSWNNPYEEDA